MRRMLKTLSIGVMGGGQLGRMFVHAAQRLGMTVMVLDPQADCPAAQAADFHLQAAYDDHRALDELASRCDVITTEFENVPAPSLVRLAQRKPVRPSAAAVSIAQDRWLEKQFFREQGIATAPCWSLEDLGEFHRQASIHACREAGFPAILKTRRLGYDGKGQIDVPDFESLPGAWAALGHADAVLESRLDLRFELSVVLARGQDAALSMYPTIENRHTKGILDRSYFPARCDARLASQAGELAARLAHGLDYEGVLCVEFFVVGPAGDSSQWQLVANEMAPRPHNSGHVTMDACAISQFEQQARVLAGLPLGSCNRHAFACLINLLGDRWFDRDGNYCEPDWARLLAIEGLHLHLYGKREARLGRKMGHINLCASSEALVDEALAHVIGILERSL
jgi:5-(carboxyamino)imidazole ribonucleotide synthase